MLRGPDQKVKYWKKKRIAERRKRKGSLRSPRVGKARDSKCSVLVPQGTKREKTDYTEGKNLARLIMGNLISWLANRNGSPGPCVYELTIYSGKTNTGQQECEKEQNKFNFTCNTQHLLYQLYKLWVSIYWY